MVSRIKSRLRSIFWPTLIKIKLVQAGLLILLVVVYTCSDWLMDLRTRRRAYARETAARQALDHISKYERLKQVKDTAKRQASKLTRKLTQSFNRKQPEISTGEELQVSRLHFSKIPSLSHFRCVCLITQFVLIGMLT